jgi:hypothetical protein
VAAIKLRLDSVPASLPCELAAFLIVLGVVIGHLSPNNNHAGTESYGQ